jgi:hypothetical protein
VEWFVHARARTLVQEHAKEVNKIWEKVNLGHIIDDWEVSNGCQILFSEVCGEAGSVCEGTVTD